MQEGLAGIIITPVKKQFCFQPEDVGVCILREYQWDTRERNDQICSFLKKTI